MNGGPVLRSPRERLIQTVCFEALGLLLVAPLYSLVAGDELSDSFVLIAALSVAVMLWSACYNTAFDWVEGRVTGRVASARPHALRVAHALGLEVSAVIVSCPLIYALTPLGWVDSLLADLGLTLAYAAYAYGFHWAFDRLRPVPA